MKNDWSQKSYQQSVDFNKAMAAKEVETCSGSPCKCSFGCRPEADSIPSGGSRLILDAEYFQGAGLEAETVNATSEEDLHL